MAVCLISCLITSCKKKNQTGETEAVEEPQEETYDFYSPAEDNASWVENLLMKIEEERIAEEISKMEDSLSEYQLEEEMELPEEESEDSDDDSDTAEETQSTKKNPIEEFFEKQQTEKFINGKNNELRFFEFDNEILYPQYTDDGLILIHSADGNVVRNYYDTSYNLIKKEEWKITSAADAKKLRTEIFVYSNETGKVETKEITTENSQETVLYNEASLPLASKKYDLKDDNKYIVMERNWSYDEQNRVLKNEQKEYSYKDSDYSNKPELFSRRYEYNYKNFASGDDAESKAENQIPPDSKYYENNILKMKNQYTEKKGTYFSWVYFDSSFSVKTYYEDELRVRDEYYNNGQLFRTKVYEGVEK